MKIGDLVCSDSRDLYVLTLKAPYEYGLHGFEVPGSGPFVYVDISGRGNGSLVLILLPSGVLVEVHPSRLRPL